MQHCIITNKNHSLAGRLASRFSPTWSKQRSSKDLTTLIFQEHKGVEDELATLANMLCGSLDITQRCIKDGKQSFFMKNSSCQIA